MSATTVKMTWVELLGLFMLRHLGTLFHVWIVTRVWEWHVAPFFGCRLISMWNAWFGMAFVGLVSYQSVPEDKTKTASECAIEMLGTLAAWAILLGFAWWSR